MATSCQALWTAGGVDISSAYGNNYVSSNSVSRNYYTNEAGTLWSSSTNLTKIRVSVIAALGGGGISGGSQYTVSYTCQLTCNGATVTLPSGSITSTAYSGYGNPYIGFTWNSYWSGNSNSAVGGDITNATFLAGIKNKYPVTITFTYLSKGYILTNTYMAVNSWEANNAPTTPTFNYPVASKTTYNTKPRFSMKGTDADGNSLTYQYSMNNSTWTNLATSVSSGTSKSGQVSTAQSTGSKTLYLRTYDGASYSSVASRAFTIGSTSLGASINNIIDDTIIDNAQSYITNLASYYGNSAPSWITCNAGTKLNLAQITELNTRLKALSPAQSFTVPSANSTISASLFSTTINNAIKNS